jgi:hypothetical protein
VVGGVSLGAGEEPEPDVADVAEEPEEDEEAEKAEEPDEAAAAGPARAVGWVPAWTPAGLVPRAALWRCLEVGEGVGVVGADVDGPALGAAVAWPTVCAGAVRANKVAKPTAVTALSWVARQVRRERRRSPTVRAASGGSSILSILVGKS